MRDALCVDLLEVTWNYVRTEEERCCCASAFRWLQENLIITTLEVIGFEGFTDSDVFADQLRFGDAAGLLGPRLTNQVAHERDSLSDIGRLRSQ